MLKSSRPEDCDYKAATNAIPLKSAIFKTLLKERVTNRSYTGTCYKLPFIWISLTEKDIEENRSRFPWIVTAWLSHAKTRYSA